METLGHAQTFSQLLREGNKFTDRDFMKVLAMGHPKLKRREADPSQFTVGELLVLATLIGRPITEVMKVVLAQVTSNKEAAQKREEAVELAAGRKYFPRQPKEGKQD
ncbi:hypothetical protein [Hymenobacter sp. BT491]|uniref:hypothetical protein n=1 Tax=Hymenobacter sp. BT491 TaxID=2766779 RepID=UPI0016537AC0|nr:hypothetical protein [Hymenobacter sp. BT491]MBC6992491.1 hypothetical protein [Hymenobacter sp. BT491]